MPSQLLSSKADPCSALHGKMMRRCRLSVLPHTVARKRNLRPDSFATNRSMQSHRLANLSNSSSFVGSNTVSIFLWFVREIQCSLCCCRRQSRGRRVFERNHERCVTGAIVVPCCRMFFLARCRYSLLFMIPTWCPWCPSYSCLRPLPFGHTALGWWMRGQNCRDATTT